MKKPKQVKKKKKPPKKPIFEKMKKSSSKTGVKKKGKYHQKVKINIPFEEAIKKLLTTPPTATPK